MNTINTAEELKQAIIDLEARQDLERRQMHDQFVATYEYHKPAKILKRTFANAVGSIDVKENAVSIFLGLASGYIGKKLIIGSSKNPIKQLLGNVLVLGLTNFVAKNPEVGRTIETIIKTLTRNIGPKKHSDVDEEE